MLGRFVESIYGLGALNIRCLPIGSFSSVFHFALILPQLLDLQARIVRSMMWLQTRPEFIMALLGGSWRLISMANWCEYIYCAKCDRPYHSWQCRTVYTPRGNGKYYTTSYCLDCSEVMGVKGSPKYLRITSFVALGISLFEFPTALSSNDQQSLNGFYLGGIIGIFALGAYLHTKRQYKPIYDRWVHKHGTNPDDWPTPTKSK